MVMEGDPRNPKTSLLKKYDIPIDHISYEYVEKCTDKKELERIVRILRSGEEGFYPDLLRVTEERLCLYAPDSRVLRQETAVLTKESLSSDEWKAVESDLLSWEEEMKVIDKSLDFEKSRMNTVGNKSLPSIRKIVQPNSKPKPNEKKLIRNAKNERIKSGDYKAWDKFDVDKELLKIDVEEERKKEENEKKKREIKKLVTEKKVDIDIDKDSYSSMEQQILANQAKDRGNECYKSGDLTNALKYYDLSIKLHPTSIAFNNRAMTYLKLNQYEDAIKDCNVVLSKEKSNVKALHRRATAYQKMASDSNNFKMLALQDLNDIICLEPNNKVAQADLQKLITKSGFNELGKKFRMTIQENDKDTNRNIKDEVSKKKELSNAQDICKNVNKLPLTYYGPSTSTFQCEPYSTTHRSLSGSLLSTEIMCKCNSKRLRQNPLCQKCGEAVATPKPSSKPSSKSSSVQLKSESNVKAINDTKNAQQKLESSIKEKLKNEGNLIEVKEIETSKADKEIHNEASAILSGTKEKNLSVVEKKKINPEAVDQHLKGQTDENKSEIEAGGTSIEEVRGKIINDLDPSINDASSRESKESKRSKTSKKLDEGKTVEEIQTPTAEKILKPSHLKSDSSEKATRDESSPAEVKSSKGKKKKKSKGQKENRIRKQLELIEPVKVVHAAKYLHPTSVEPKVKTQGPKKPDPEINFAENNHFKAFVPNRQCFSVRRESGSLRPANPETLNSSSVGLEGPTNKEMGKSFSSQEGNKENVLNNSLVNGNGNPENLNSKKETNMKESIDSAYKFVKTWEELKKLDPSYAKRAEIIRLLEPADLGKVIGIKLDSDMLSSILECLEKHFIETDTKVVVEFLKQLPEVPRFGLIKMFLAEADVKKMRNLISAVESKGFILDENVKKALAVIS